MYFLILDLFNEDVLEERKIVLGNELELGKVCSL